MNIKPFFLLRLPPASCPSSFLQKRLHLGRCFLHCDSVGFCCFCGVAFGCRCRIVSSVEAAASSAAVRKFLGNAGHLSFSDHCFNHWLGNFFGRCFGDDFRLCNNVFNIAASTAVSASATVSSSKSFNRINRLSVSATASSA